MLAAPLQHLMAQPLQIPGTPMNHVIVVVQMRLSDLHKDVTADALVRSLLRVDGMLLVTLQTRVVVMTTLVTMVEILQVMAEIGTTSTASAALLAGVVAHPRHEASMMAALVAPNGSSLTIQSPKEASKVCFLCCMHESSRTNRFQFSAALYLLVA